jgi:site-specific recombinase XerD
MASLYQKPNSKFWWINYRDPVDLKVKAKSTGFKIGVGADTRRAETLAAEFSLRERSIHHNTPTERWELWVMDWLDLRYKSSPNTLTRAKAAWRTFKMFLKDKEIQLPRQVTREHCFDYMAWRQKPDVRRGKYKAIHNTALIEVKFFSLIMAEAVMRKYAPFNPVHDLKIKRQPPAHIKPELTPEAVAIIREKIKTEPDNKREFFNNSFEIAFHHGVRITPTHLNPMTDVYVNAEGQWCITFTQKGNVTSTKILHPNLIPLFTKLRADGKTETYPRPKSPSKEWFNFLTRHGLKKLLPHVCFHSTRVTVATTLARSNVPQRIAMEYVDHASTTVHRSYVRLRPQDFSKPCHDAIK